MDPGPYLIGRPTPPLPPQMDPHYVMYPPPASPSSGPAPPSLCRAQAMRQWGLARADHDLEEARVCVANLEPWARAAWQRCQHQLGDLPVEIHVDAGEPLVSKPVCLDAEDLHTTLRVLQGVQDPLVHALVSVDTGAVLQALQPFDPLSWHCRSRVGQHLWFTKQYDGRAAAGRDASAQGVLGQPPHARVVLSPREGVPLRRPQWPNESLSAQREALDDALRRRTLTVAFDVLVHPPQRQVVYVAQQVEEPESDPGRPPPAHSPRPLLPIETSVQASWRKRRRFTICK